ncbi:MAG TPA: hypothetical protein VIK99_04860 [Thermaerobacter sp.]
MSSPWEWLQEAKATGKVAPEEEEVLAILLAPIEEDVKFTGRNGLTVVPRTHAEDRARRAFGPFGYGLEIKNVVTVTDPKGLPLGVQVVATFWAEIPGRGRYSTDVIGFAPFDRMAEDEGWGTIYNRTVKTARGDALKQGLFALGFGWDLRRDDEASQNGRPAHSDRSDSTALRDEPLSLEAVVKSFMCRPPGRGDMVIYRFPRPGKDGTEYFVTAVTASVKLPNHNTLDHVELTFSSQDGVLGLADQLRIGHHVRIRGFLREAKNPGVEPYRWIRVVQLEEHLNNPQGPTLAEWAAAQGYSEATRGEG